MLRRYICKCGCFRRSLICGRRHAGRHRAPASGYSTVDTCVLCDLPTQYRRDEPVALRHSYVEGAGQLCEECWRAMSALW